MQNIWKIALTQLQVWKIITKNARKKCAKTCNNVKIFAKTQLNCAKMRKNIQKIVCKPNKLAQLNKNSIDGVTRITLFLPLWWGASGKQCTRQLIRGVAKKYFCFAKFIIFSVFPHLSRSSFVFYSMLTIEWVIMSSILNFWKICNCLCGFCSKRLDRSVPKSHNHLCLTKTNIKKIICNYKSTTGLKSFKM